MQNQFREIYDQVRMPEECSQRIEQAMQNKAKSGSRRKPGCWQMPRLAAAQVFALTIAALFLLADGTVYACTGVGIISRAVSFAGNAVFTNGIDEDGNNVATGTFDTANALAPAELKDGRLWFTANGECIDITDQVSEDKAYTYEYRDDQGMIHYLIVGGDPESFGYAEFMYDETQHPGWVGGYFQGGKVGESVNPGWLKNAKEKLGIPWP